MDRLVCFTVKSDRFDGVVVESVEITFECSNKARGDESRVEEAEEEETVLEWDEEWR